MATSAFSVYTLGDTSTFRSMLEGVALLFQDPLFSSDAYLGLGFGAFFGAMILMLIMIYQAAFNQRMDIRMLLAPLFAYIILTGPKVPVQIVDVYNIDAPQQVNGIPIGLAIPLTIGGGAAYLFTQAMEQSYSTPNSPRILTDGFVMPLKTLNAIRSINLSETNPYLAELVNATYKSCVTGNPKFNSDEYLNSPDSYQYFNNFLTTQAFGVVPFTAVDGSQSIITCSDAADRINVALTAFMYGDGSGGIETLEFNFQKLLNLSLSQMDKSGGSGKLVTTQDFLDDFAKITELSADQGRMFMTNALFNQTLISASLCAAHGAENDEDNSSRCTAWVQANEQTAEDNAAKASGFLQVMQDGQNILIIIAILMFPLVVMMIMFLGTKSMKVVSSYLIYVASTYLWLPMATLVNFIVFARLKNTVYTFTGKEDSDLFAIADYPAFYEAISNALSLANGLIATIPIFCMMFFSGMTMAAIALQNRWNQGKSKYADTTLDAPHIMGASAVVAQKSSLHSQGLSGQVDASGGKAWEGNFTQKTSAQLLETMALSEKKSVLESKRKALAHQLSLTHASAASGTLNNELQTNVESKNNLKLIDGIGYTITSGTSNTGIYGSNGASSSHEAKETDQKIASGVNLRTANAKFKIGLGFGEYQKQTEMTSVDGSVNDPTAPQIPSLPSKTTKGGELDLSIRGIKIEAGATVKQQLGGNLATVNRHDKNDSEQKTPLANSGTISDSVNQYVYKLVEDESTSEMKNGRVHQYTESTAVTDSASEEDTLSKVAALQRQYDQTLSEIDTIQRQITETLSSTMSSNLLAADVLHRISAHKSVREQLEELDREYLLKYGESWAIAKAEAEGALANTTVGINKAVNPELYDHLITYTASYYLDGNAANEAHKIVTGIDTMKMFEMTNNATEYDWKNWKDIEAEADRAMATVDQAFANRRQMSLDQANSMIVLDPNNRNGYFAAPEFAKYPEISYANEANQPIQEGRLAIKGSQQEQNTARIYNAFLNAGFTPRQARIMTAEVGRENSMRVEGMYGLHNDPHKKELINGGIISFNDSRKRALDKFMASKGLLKSGNPNKGTGSYVEGQASLNAMATFIRNELESGKNKGWSAAWTALQNDKLTDAEIHKVVGKRYILWRYDDPTYQASGLKNIATFRGILDRQLKEQNLLVGTQPNKTILNAAAKVDQAGLDRTVLQQPKMLSQIIPEKLRYKAADQLTKEEIREIAEKAQEKLEVKTHKDIEKKFGIKVVRDSEGKVDYEISDFTKFAKQLVPPAAPKPLREVVAEAPAKVAKASWDKVTGIRTPLAAEMDIVSGKHQQILGHPNIKPYMTETPKSFGIPDDVTLPKNQIYGFNIKNEVNQDKIDRWVESEKARNEHYDKRNQDMVNAVVQNAASTSTGNKSQTNNNPKTIEDWAKQGSDANQALIEKIKKDGISALDTNRANTEFNKWSGAQGE
ncbi:conjugal transfer protein TraG N-terminal domain-containing protein [Acinetobacter sp. SwsAc5]|uniref:conjugal transfer protein TraG N-terminal domain-containing protein n=1 Tax=Acinetobacter sp. SwsAc5 TaxID=2749438 RepID=UPI0015BB2402|nr:conjugal transfer protein TraG N-terminal domain-containing protein [Acinetobacter sp. SwsAc5]NWK51958.1 conjugal transfer protein TraG N-terminal domain-containing protein [Acinetobacter sp. SwsAc5]